MALATLSRGSLEPYLYDSVEYYPHQIEGIRQLARQRSFLLADDMGLGKSLQALTVFIIDIVMGLSKTAIIVCPVTLKGNWADEIVKFTRVPFVVLQGTPKERQALLIKFAEMDDSQGKILIVNYEQVKPYLGQLNAMFFDVGIYDEAHYMKNPTSARTKACHALLTRRSMLLTGTPMLNHVDDLWALLHKIDPDRWPYYYSFINRYAVFGGYKDKQIVGVKNEKRLIEQLHDVMLRRLKSEVLDLPEVQIIERRVDLTKQQQMIYDSIVTELKYINIDGDEEEVENALTKFLRLKQVCGTTYGFLEEDISSKLDLVIEDDIELLKNGQKVIMFTQFRPVLECYARRMAEHPWIKSEGINIYQLHGDVKQPDRQPIVNQWTNDPKPAVIACMIQVAGIGLNMVASRHLGFVDELFVPGLNQQAIDRAHRIGQNTTQPVQVRKYICRKTIENRVQQILRTKSKLFGEIVETDPNWKKKIMKAIMEEEAA
jgi:SNF2 family DNA or RNA helicase